MAKVKSNVNVVFEYTKEQLSPQKDIFFHQENEYSDPESSFSDMADKNQIFERDQNLIEYKPLIYTNILKQKSPFNSSPKLTIKSDYRAITIDWMSKVCSEMQVLEETKFSAIALFDRVISQKPIQTNQIQLYAATSLWIEFKIEETVTPLLSDFVYLCGNAYSEQKFRQCEREILKMMGFSVALTTPLIMLKSFLNDLGILFDQNHPILALSYFFADSLLFIPFFQSMNVSGAALACLFLAYNACGINGHLSVGETFCSYNLIFEYSNAILRSANQIIQKSSGYAFETLDSFFQRTKISFNSFQSNLLIPFSKNDIQQFFSQ